MTGSAALDILIGLFTLYFVMSTLSSALVEGISNLLGFRAKMLNTFLSLQFKEGKNDKSATRLPILYDSLSSIQIGQTFGLRFGQDTKYLSTIKAENFTQALYDAIGFTGNEQFDLAATRSRFQKDFESQIKQLLKKHTLNIAEIVDPSVVTTEALEPAIKAVRNNSETDSDYSKLPPDVQASVNAAMDDLVANFKALDLVNKLPPSKIQTLLIAGTKGVQAVNAGIEELKDIVSILPPSNIRNVLIGAIQQSQDKIADVSTQVSKWFDGEMERLSDLYKKRTQVILFIVGFILAFVLNVDTIAVANALAKNPALRDAIVEQAKSITENPDDNSGTAASKWKKSLNQLSELGLPTGWNAECGKEKITDGNLVADTRPCWVFSHIDLSKIDLAKIDVEFLKTSFSEMLSVIPGILITAAAVALGAPFWFDLLKSLTTRASGNKTDTTTTTTT